MTQVRVKNASFGLRHKVIVAIRGLIDGPKHKGGVLPAGTIESPIAQIAHLTNQRLQWVVSMWRRYEHSIPSAVRQAGIELQIAREDLKEREATLAAHIEEYRRTHGGLRPPAVGPRRLGIGACALYALFAFGEMPITGAAFERLLPTDWERLVATVAAAAVTICLAHQIGKWFAQRGRTLGQRIFGWVMVLVLMAILMTLSIIRTAAVTQRLHEPLKSNPGAHLVRKGDRLDG